MNGDDQTVDSPSEDNDSPADIKNAPEMPLTY